jgi:hypothetical protein
MFKKGSRYYNLPQSRHLTANGEWPLSVDLRFIDPVPGQFLHTVSDRERLDLLAYRYYTDPRKWWLIADANPDLPFPSDLLDTAPRVEEELTLQCPGYLERVAKLMLSLRFFGSVTDQQSDFFTTRVTVNYPTATTRVLITDQIARCGFHLVNSVEWPASVGSMETFTFDDPSAKQSWNELVKVLGTFAGVLDLFSVTAGDVIHIKYNELQLDSQAVEWVIEKHGFVVLPQQSQRSNRLGMRITIPPNQA